MKSQNHHAAFYLCASIILLFVFIFAIPLTSAQIIISTSNVEVWSGESATLEVIVMNPAGVDASFDVVILQPCPVGHSGMIRETIASGVSETISIRVGAGSTNVDKTGRCQVKVSATTKPSNYDTAYFDYDVHKARECYPGEYKGEQASDCIYWCNDEGTWEMVKCCDKDEWLNYDPKYGYDGWDCVKKNGALPGFEGILGIIGVIIAFVTLRRRLCSR